MIEHVKLQYRVQDGKTTVISCALKLFYIYIKKNVFNEVLLLIKTVTAPQINNEYDIDRDLEHSLAF
jgi:hypothetical protein